MEEDEVHQTKAQECLAGAQVAFDNGRYNNAANRAYYACFHAAVVALIRAGTRRDEWSHEEVPALFSGVLVGRRHLYPRELRGALESLRQLRLDADYGLGLLSRTRVERQIRQAIYFCREVLGDGR